MGATNDCSYEVAYEYALVHTVSLAHGLSLRYLQECLKSR